MSTEDFVNRTDDPSAGQDFDVRVKDSTGARTQGMHLDPEVMGDILTAGATGTTAAIQESAKASEGRLFRAEVILIAAGAAGDRWLLVVDKATAAANTDPPKIRGPKLAGDFASIDLGAYGVKFDDGIQIVLSSTPNEVTLAPAEGFFQWAVL